jgi:hypothetical protein
MGDEPQKTGTRACPFFIAAFLTALASWRFDIDFSAPLRLCG